MRIMPDCLQLQLIKLLPKIMLTRGLGRIAGMRLPQFLLNFAIARFVHHYRIDMRQVTTKNFPTFNDFFARPIAPESHPVALAQDIVVSPVDGIVGAFGHIQDETLFQAKSIPYSLAGLVINPIYQRLFADGDYVTIYLSPRHYHRIHSPLDANVAELFYIPGMLYPVNRLAVENIPGLFTLNERLISLLSHPILGKIALIQVGATVVGKIKVVYDRIESQHLNRTVHRQYQGVTIAKGKEIARFEIGSTVIMLFEKNRIEWVNAVTGNEIRWGEAIATVKKSHT